MESRSGDRQRRASAKCSAAPTLPSSQDEEFHLRMIDLYAQQPCLWNTTLCEYQNAELKREAWEDITRHLGSHLNASFVRNRIQSMRYRLNVYKLQLLEYKMSPETAKMPEKLYFMDKFDFLDSILSLDDEQSPPEKSESETSDVRSSLSISSICEQRVQQEQLKLPQLVQRLKAASQQLPETSPVLDVSLRSHLQRLSLVEQGKELTSDNSLLHIPSVVRKRLQQQLSQAEPEQKMNTEVEVETETEAEAEKSSSKANVSLLSIPQTSLRAKPGDSISKTRVSKLPKQSKKMELLEAQQLSDDEDLYRLHWSVRREQSSRRAVALPPNHELHPSQAMPPLLFGTSLPRSSTKSRSTYNAKT
ncbi:uncharacterized protein LOC117569542 [Drosophila albomicans]|uniref:Uncharacterized protein LOC117569542 n=1 Tax=Drosophila albomicans TaxID=7291 RepID=A0A6P8YHQ9_DROAB|nr:uncharacterized protein LOC117569542 [Drosophila albomicans]